MGHTYYSLFHHLVWGTQKRAPLLNADMKKRLFAYMHGIAKGEEVTLVQVNGPADHVHLLVGLKPEHTLAAIVRKLKANSSKWVHTTFPDMAHFAWQEGYSAFSVSKASLRGVVLYIRNQEEHHKGKGFGEEYHDFLREHDIPIDEQSIWT